MIGDGKMDGDKSNREKLKIFVSMNLAIIIFVVIVLVLEFVTMPLMYQCIIAFFGILELFIIMAISLYKHTRLKRKEKEAP